MSGLFFLILDGSVEEEKKEANTIEAVYLYPEDLKQSKSDDGEKKKKEEEKMDRVLIIMWFCEYEI